MNYLGNSALPLELVQLLWQQVTRFSWWMCNDFLGTKDCSMIAPEYLRLKQPTSLKAQISYLRIAIVVENM